MGMFDYIRCEALLPDGFNGQLQGELQTKDFDRQMAVHVITPDGRLLFDRAPYDETPKMVDETFNGIVNFYRFEEVRREGTWYMREHGYKAKFIDGQLVSIELVPDSEFI